VSAPRTIGEKKSVKSIFGSESPPKRHKASSNLKPELSDLRPLCGKCDDKNEIWIKGKNFSSNVVVFFGHYKGVVTEVSENLVIVLSPKIEIKAKTTVEVLVSNIYENEECSAEKKLYYEFLC